MNIDIICPLYNAEKCIKKLDISIKKQKAVSINKIIYVLTKSSDDTENILKEIRATYRVIEKQDFSHSLTREKEAFRSKAEILVFITQDIIIEDEMWLYNLVRDIENGKCVASYSRQLCENNTIEKYTRELNYPDTSYYKTQKDIKKMQLKTFFFSDAASAIKRQVFIDLKGYDGKDFPTNEDMYIAYKIITNGYTIKYCADSKVIHSHRFTLKQQYMRYFYTGKFFRQNTYLKEYKVNSSGMELAQYILKRILQDKNYKALINFVPNMIVRFIGMKVGENGL